MEMHVEHPLIMSSVRLNFWIFARSFGLQYSRASEPSHGMVMSKSERRALLIDCKVEAAIFFINDSTLRANLLQGKVQG